MPSNKLKMAPSQKRLGTTDCTELKYVLVTLNLIWQVELLFYQFACDYATERIA